MLYFSSAPVPPDDVDREQYEALKEFKLECNTKGLVGSYKSVNDFRDQFSRQLTQTIYRSYQMETRTTIITPLPQAPLATPPMSDEAKELLVATADDPSGVLMCIRHFEGLVVQAGCRNFAKERDARSEARWEGVIKELERLGVVEDCGHKREVFAVTDKGFRVADLLRSSQS